MTAHLTLLTPHSNAERPAAARPGAAVLADPAKVARFGETLRAQSAEEGVAHAAAHPRPATAPTPPGGDRVLELEDHELASYLLASGAAGATAATALTPVVPQETPDTEAATTDDGAQPWAAGMPPAATGDTAPVAPISTTSTSANAPPLATGVQATQHAAADVGRFDSRHALAQAPAVASRSSNHPSGVHAISIARVNGDAAEPGALPAVTSSSALAPASRVVGSPAAVSVSGMEQMPAALTSQSHAPLLVAASGAGEATHSPATAEPGKSPDAQAAQGRQALAEALGERLHVQISRGTSQAVIRLDPPNMGTIEIVIRHEAGGMQVHLSASHGDIARQLHGIGAALGQDLIQRNHGDVSVQVHDGSRDGDARQRQRHGSSGDAEADPGRALNTPEESARPVAFFLAGALE